MKWRLVAASAALAVGLSGLPAHAASGSGMPVTDKPVRFYALDGARVLYQTYEDGPSYRGDGGNARLFLYDLKTGAEREVTTRFAPQAFTLSGERFAYAGSGGLVLQSLAGDEVKLVDGFAVEPRMAGTTLVWAQPRSTLGYRDGDFYRHDLASGQTTKLGNLSFGSSDGTYPVAFDGQYLVTTAHGSTVTAIDVGSGQQYSQSISHPGGFAVGVGNGRVAYLQRHANSSTGYTLHLWHPATRGYREVGSLATPQGQTPVVHGDLLAWIDTQQAVRLMDLRTGSTRTLVTDGAKKGRLQVSDSFVVYQGEDGRLRAVPLRSAEPAQAAFHTVRYGEVLWQIAARYGVDLHDLIRANNLLQPDVLWPGQQLYLPYPVSPRYESYTVRSGDTLAAIAVRYKTTAESLVQLNQLKSTTLYVGQVLKVSRGPGEIFGPGARTYAVMPGDTWYSIAARLGIPMGDLLRLNQMTDAGPLLAAQPIRIPN